MKGSQSAFERFEVLSNKTVIVSALPLIGDGQTTLDGNQKNNQRKMVMLVRCIKDLLCGVVAITISQHNLLLCSLQL